MPARLRTAWLSVALTAGLGVTLTGCRAPAEHSGLAPGTRTYENATAGFRFELPPSWATRYRIHSRDGPAARGYQPLARHAVLFNYVPIAAAVEEKTLLAVVVFDKADWSGLNTGGPPLGLVLAERGDRVYVARLPRSNPFDPGTDDVKNFEAMRVTPEQVQAAFALLASR
jgi:hypothetical protein